METDNGNANSLPINVIEAVHVGRPDGPDWSAGKLGCKCSLESANAPLKLKVAVKSSSTSRKNWSFSPRRSPIVCFDRPGQWRRNLATSPGSRLSPRRPSDCEAAWIFLFVYKFHF